MSDADLTDLDEDELRTVLWQDSLSAAALYAVAPRALGGIVVRGHAGPVRDAWLDKAKRFLPEDVPLRKIPGSISDDRLLGGLDLSATLSQGRAVASTGLLSEADGGTVVLPMAERLAARTTAHLLTALDTGSVSVEREGVSRKLPARFGFIALDEGIGPDERPPSGLVDRAAFLIDLENLRYGDIADSLVSPENVWEARALFPHVVLPDSIVESLGHTAIALSIPSLRIAILALAAARAAAALNGRTEVGPEEAQLAARLVLLPRGQGMPEPPAPPDEEQEEAPPEDSQDPEQNQDDQKDPDKAEDDKVLEAADALLPDGLLRDLLMGRGARNRARSNAGAGQMRESPRRGRPAGIRPGNPKAGYRLSLVDSLRTAAPWQPLRRRQRPDAPVAVHVRPEDFRVVRYKEQAQSVILFIVDASGSAAFQRLAEAKGAVELLLADCYVRRDRVALIAFRGTLAEMILPPTRSLTRAKRVLADLPGGGGTPMATAIDAAIGLALDIRRRGETPILCFLTDGRANIARDGAPGRPQAKEDALVSARALAALEFTTLFIDTAPRPQDAAQALARAMDARYLPLPVADAKSVNTAVRASL
ncbi:MAG: magnesium chelatase subunit D [Alphaproteobacteria bacterium]|nr:magnesium chelatase subunit D [Alphaproteobacteria bacterium]